VKGLLEHPLTCLTQGVHPRHWHRWRTAERALVREKTQFERNAGPYANPAEPKQPEALLCERINGIVAQEFAEWTADSMSSEKT
jgi:hypothetical protein